MVNKHPRFITKTALKRLMKVEGDANIIAADAITELQEHLQDLAVEITKKALALTKHAKRKTITKSDIKLAV